MIKRIIKNWGVSRVDDVHAQIKWDGGDIARRPLKDLEDELGERINRLYEEILTIIRELKKEQE